MGEVPDRADNFFHEWDVHGSHESKQSGGGSRWDWMQNLDKFPWNLAPEAKEDRERIQD